jgi:hypothetical protein
VQALDLGNQRRDILLGVGDTLQIHRQVCEALLVLAIEERIRTGRIGDYRLLRN